MIQPLTIPFSDSHFLKNIRDYKGFTSPLAITLAIARSSLINKICNLSLPVIKYFLLLFYRSSIISA
jgi:hypothetical protein